MQVIDPNDEAAAEVVQDTIDSYDVEDFDGCDDIHDVSSIDQQIEPVAVNDIANATDQCVLDETLSQVSVNLPDCKYRITS